MTPTLQPGDMTLPCRRTPRPDWFGPALRRYDPKLRVRWSMERRRFVIEARAKSRLGIFRPVIRYKNDLGIIVEERLPELSERSIHWRDCVYPVTELERLDKRAFDYIRCADIKRFSRNVA
ncbi:MAG: hypothetical protein KGR26_14640, partial [Cyanobacteria bacterium REEB65]|nr:hypothetical protein [Cyanobacteria bacterium REEB65]